MSGVLPSKTGRFDMMGIFYIAEANYAGVGKVERAMGDTDNLPGPWFKFYPTQGYAVFVASAKEQDAVQRLSEDGRRPFLDRWPQTQEQVDALNVELGVR